uniref:NB-ARC domain containing protein n=1 Tax=Solanum tuberosum TaxID=4113 RepID=M1BW03_SOLTU
MVIRRKASSNVSPGSRSNSSNKLLCLNSFDAFLKDTRKDGNVMAPTLHISNPEVNKIIQECEAAMALKSNLAIKPPIFTLNTLAHEVPTQSLESFRELQGESGQIILSKGNDKDLVKGLRSAPRWADLVDEEVQVAPPILNGKLSPQALEFVPKSVIAKKNEVEALASGVNPTNAYAIDLGDDSFDEDDRV